MNKKEEILNTALSLFSQHGYENVGVQKIVEGCAVTKPTLYHYFGSKKGLLEQLINNHFQPFLVLLNEAAEYQHDIVLTLKKMTDCFFRFAENDKDFYRFQQSLHFSSIDSEARKSIQPAIEEQFGIIRNVFLKAENDHGNMKGRSQRYALTFLGMVNAYISAFFYNDLALTDEVSRQACHQFMHGIFS